MYGGGGGGAGAAGGVSGGCVCVCGVNLCSGPFCPL